MASKLFDLNAIKNHPKRSGFDLSSHRPFTAKVGELLPCYTTLVFPDDEFKLPHEHFTRTAPVNTAAFARIREYFDWYFVPLRLINKNLPQAYVQMQDNPVQASGLTSSKSITTDIPHAPLSSIFDALVSINSYDVSSGEGTRKNIFGFIQAGLSYKLLQYLGYGNLVNPEKAADNYLKESFNYTTSPSYTGKYNKALNMNVHLLYPLAYQKIYADHYRFQQWEKNEPFTYNVDYYSGGDLLSSVISGGSDERKSFVKGNNLFTLRYANWPKDLYMGLLPDSQLGSISAVSLSVSNPDLSAQVYWQSNAGSFGAQGTRDDLTSNQIKVNVSGSPSTAATTGPLKVNFPTAITGSFNILQLRMAEALQRFREIAQCADQTFLGQLESIWNVRLPKMLSDLSTWIGGSASNLDISSVENQNLSDSDALIKGKGIGSSVGSEYFSAKEPGVLMCIYHAVPFLDHTITGQTPDLLYTNTADFPNPVFDRIGLQTIPISSYINDVNFTTPTISLANFPMGYVPRYAEIKTGVDRVFGAFTTTLKDWVATLSPEYLATNFASMVSSGKMDYRFFKVNPSILDNIFAVKATTAVDTDQFYVNFFAGVKVVRSFDYDGMPY